MTRFNPDDLIFRVTKEDRERRDLKSLASLLRDGFTEKDSFVIKYKEGDQAVEVYLKTKVGLCYQLTLEEYQQAMREMIGG